MNDKIVPAPFQPGRAAPGRERRNRFPPARILFWSLLAGLVILTWWILTLKAVEIRTDPTADSLVLDASPFLGWKVAGRYLLREGRYTLHGRKAGYEPLDVEIEVGASPNPSFRFTLKKLPGKLLIRAGDVTGAVVSIDGRELGALSTTPLELAPGRHSIEVRAPSYQPFKTEVDILGRGHQQTLDVALTPRWARVSFRSRPAGAAVSVDDHRIGTTPLDQDLQAGTHSLKLELPGRKPYTGSFKVEANRPLVLKTIRLAPAHGTLVLHTDPADATVSVDGEFKGSTPLTLSLSPSVAHTIKLTRAGYQPVEQHVRLKPEEERELSLHLTALLGQVEIDAEPPGATLLVNGQPRGPAHQTLSLPAVPQTIEIKAEQFETYKTTLTPRPGVPRSLHVKLKSLDPSDIFGLPTSIQIPHGPRLILVKGGRFTMGAPRREPGRRANETIRQVELVRPFYMGTTEVTNKQFRFFKAEHLSGKIGPYSLERDDHPVVRVTWQEAALYCNWLSRQQSLPSVYQRSGAQLIPMQPAGIGYRLPTEAEWAYAARISPGHAPLKYPWGQSLPVPAGAGNYADLSAAGFLPSTLKDVNDGFPVTAPAGSFKPNALGLYNMGDNVSEWIQDIYTIYPPSEGQVFRDPVGPSTGELHVIRGASWRDDSVSALRLSYRGYGNKARPEVGFRVARYAR